MATHQSTSVNFPGTISCVTAGVGADGPPFLSFLDLDCAALDISDHIDSIPIACQLALKSETKNRSHTLYLNKLCQCHDTAILLSSCIKTKPNHVPKLTAANRVRHIK